MSEWTEPTSDPSLVSSPSSSSTTTLASSASASQVQPTYTFASNHNHSALANSTSSPSSAATNDGSSPAPSPSATPASAIRFAARPLVFTTGIIPGDALGLRSRALASTSIADILLNFDPSSTSRVLKYSRWLSIAPQLFGCSESVARLYYDTFVAIHHKNPCQDRPILSVDISEFILFLYLQRHYRVEELESDVISEDEDESEENTRARALGPYVPTNPYVDTTQAGVFPSSASGKLQPTGKVSMASILRRHHRESWVTRHISNVLIMARDPVKHLHDKSSRITLGSHEFNRLGLLLGVLNGGDQLDDEQHYAENLPLARATPFWRSDPHAQVPLATLHEWLVVHSFNISATLGSPQPTNRLLRSMRLKRALSQRQQRRRRASARRDPSHPSYDDEGADDDEADGDEVSDEDDEECMLEDPFHGHWLPCYETCVSNLDSQLVILNEEDIDEDGDVRLHNLQRCSVWILARFRFLFVTNCEACVFNLGVVSNLAVIRDCHELTLSLVARNLHLARVCDNSIAYLFVYNRPVFLGRARDFGASGLRLAPYNTWSPHLERHVDEIDFYQTYIGSSAPNCWNQPVLLQQEQVLRQLDFGNERDDPLDDDFHVALLHPSDFFPLSFPFSGITQPEHVDLAEETLRNPFPLPNAYRISLLERKSQALRVRQLIDQVQLPAEQRDAFQQAISAQFRQWLKSNRLRFHIANMAKHQAQSPAG